MDAAKSVNGVAQRVKACIGGNGSGNRICQLRVYDGHTGDDMGVHDNAAHLAGIVPMKSGIAGQLAAGTGGGGDRQNGQDFFCRDSAPKKRFGTYTLANGRRRDFRAVDGAAAAQGDNAFRSDAQGNIDVLVDIAHMGVRQDMAADFNNSAVRCRLELLRDPMAHHTGR